MVDIKKEYLAKASKLSKEQKERILSRMDGKLPKRLEKGKVTVQEAIALQLELEDEALQEWREKMADIRAKEVKKQLKAEEKLAKTKAKEVEKAK